MGKFTRARKVGVAALAIVALAVGPALAAHAGPEFFWDSPDNDETGAPLGTSESGNPISWQSAHSQYAGDTTSSLRLSHQQGSNWTFQWTRAAGDDSAYQMVPQFTVDQGYAASVALQVGFDTVYSHTQAAWPGGYWVSNDGMWQRPLDQTPSSVGSHDLNAASEVVTIPSNVNRVYLRLRLLDAPSSGFATITNGDVAFTPVVLNDDDDISALPTRNVVTLGADPTGVADSTDIIQAAVDDGGTVFFPAGTYKISRTIEITKSYTELYGEPGSTINVAPGSPVTAIATSPAYGVWNLHHISIHHLRIANDPLNAEPGNNLQFTQGIAFTGVRDSNIHDVELSEFQHDNIYIAHSRNVAIYDVDSQGARHGVTIQGHFDGGRYGNWDISIDRVHTRDNWDTGIVIGFYNHRVSLTNSVIEGSWAHGIDIFNSEDITVRGNRVLNWNAAHGPSGTMLGQTVGIFIHPDWGVSTNPPTARIQVIENEIATDAVFPSGVTPNAIEITGNTEDVTVSQNVITGGYRGVYIREQTYDTYWTNRPDQTPAYGGDVPRGIAILGNTVSGQTGSYLMLETTTSMPTIIQDNSFAAAATVGVTITAPSASNIELTENTFFGGGATSATESPSAIWTGNTYLPSPTALIVTTHPQSEIATEGSTAAFTAGAVSPSSATIRWQTRADTSSSWVDVAGANTAVLLVPVTAAQSGSQFRAVFSSSNGDTTSQTATLTSQEAVANDVVPPSVSTLNPQPGPTPRISDVVQASDDVGLANLAVRIFQAGVLVHETDFNAGGALSAQHGEDVALADGTYEISAAATDLAGNVSSTGTRTVRVDSTAPTVTVKVGPSFTLGTASSYAQVSFKLFDAAKIDKAVINGVVKDLTNNTWSDVNFVRAGTFGGKVGPNQLVVHDVAGNTTVFEFTLTANAD